MYFTPESSVIIINFNRLDFGTGLKSFSIEKIKLVNSKTNMLVHSLGFKNYEITDYLNAVRTLISDKKYLNSLVFLGSNDYYPFGMDSRTKSKRNYRYGFHGQEKEIETGSYSAENWKYNSRLVRRWNVDPVIKEHESPYAAFANNPFMFIDPSGEDTLYVHAQKMGVYASGEVLVFKLTFSVVQNGVEKVVQPKIPDGSKDIYIMVPVEYWKNNNIWQKDGESDEFEIRFDEYKEYPNSIRIKYVKEGSSVRILMHDGNSSSWSLGCNVPTTSIDCATEDTEIKSENSQEVLDAVKAIYDEYIPSEEKKNKWNRLENNPTDGNNFLMKTNSVATNSEIKKEDSSASGNASANKNEADTSTNNGVQQGNEPGRTSAHRIPNLQQ